MEGEQELFSKLGGSNQRCVGTYHGAGLIVESELQRRSDESLEEIVMIKFGRVSGNVFVHPVLLCSVGI